jgi:hypothetical protein
LQVTIAKRALLNLSQLLADVVANQHEILHKVIEGYLHFEAIWFYLNFMGITLYVIVELLNLPSLMVLKLTSIKLILLHHPRHVKVCHSGCQC